MLLLGAVGPGAAVAATNGTTAFTCVNQGAEHAFAKAHCTAADQVGGEYEEVPVAENTSTALLGTAGTTGGGKEVMKLKYTFGGIPVEFQAKGLDLEGSLQNLKAESGEHYVDGEGKLILTGVSVTAPAIGCKVKGEKIETKQLTLTSKGQGDAFQLAPVKGEVIAEYTVEGCTIAGAYKLTGSVKGTPDGATVAFTHAAGTAEGTLRVGSLGPKAGLEGSITFNGRDPVLEETSFTPLSFKTVETP
ncbi:MAG: hypothetical protein ACOYD4_10365 [Solirubrobacterales bacterium]